MTVEKQRFRGLSQQDIAEAHRVSTRTIREWTGWGMPRNADDSYDIFSTWQWRAAHMGGDGTVRRPFDAYR